jgi:malonyl-CoA/methylmalonyl-CoA synthetase
MTHSNLDSEQALMNENVFGLFQSAAHAHAERSFLIVDGRPLLTYGEMLSETARAASWLRSIGVGPGDRAIVQAHKSAATVILYLACLRAGVVFIPLNTAYQVGEITYFLSDAAPKLLVVSAGVPGEAAAFDGRRVVLAPDLDAAPWAGIEQELPVVSASQGDVAAILYTSGTTGRSKGALLTHGNLSSNATVLGKAWHWRDDDVLLHTLPIFHAHGLFVALHCALLHASPILFHERFNAEATIRDLVQATVFMGVPTFYTRLLIEPGLNKSLCEHVRLFISGSAPLLDSTFEEFKVRTGHTILERYGMTEALMVTSNPYHGPRIAGSVGPALEGVSVRVMADNGKRAAPGEPGVLAIKGPNLFAGYWRNPEKTALEHTEDGYFMSGDIATEDEAGFIRIVGRAKDLIISGGFNVYPKEIELAIDALEGIDESAVIGVPHPDFGEGVLAVVVRKPGCATDEPHILRALASQLAAFKRPKKIVIVDQLPRNAMGKVQKAELRDMYKGSFIATAV